MQTEKFNNGMIEFIKKAPTQFHCVAYLDSILKKNGYIKLEEKDAWNLKEKKGYYVIRDQSSIIAFYTGNGDFIKSGFKMAGAHTDSPGLKLKPFPEISVKDFLQLGVEIYGGPILDTWFDRDLSIAGRISFFDNNKIVSKLINFENPVCVIPNLAIHMNREINDSRSIAKQKELPPVIAMGDKTIFEEKIKEISPEIKNISDAETELYLYDVHGPIKTGLNGEFISGGKLDNLVSCYAGVMAIIENKSEVPALFVANDNEETGSMSFKGADGTFLKSVIQRLTKNYDSCARCLAKSVMISADNAHSLHPSHMEKHDSNNPPVINKGPVIKFNASGKYATTSKTSALIKHLASENQIKLQTFVSRTDMPCGSTIGPITASRLGIQTIDIGIPMLGMHSIRETIGRDDASDLKTLISGFFRSEIIL